MFPKSCVWWGNRENWSAMASQQAVHYKPPRGIMSSKPPHLYYVFYYSYKYQAVVPPSCFIPLLFNQAGKYATNLLQILFVILSKVFRKMKSRFKHVRWRHNKYVCFLPQCCTCWEADTFFFYNKSPLYLRSISFQFRLQRDFSSTLTTQCSNLNKAACCWVLLSKTCRFRQSNELK